MILTNRPLSHLKTQYIFGFGLWIATLSPKLFFLGIETFSTVLSHFFRCTGYYSLNLFKWAFFSDKRTSRPLSRYWNWMKLHAKCHFTIKIEEEISKTFSIYYKEQWIHAQKALQSKFKYLVTANEILTIVICKYF